MMRALLVWILLLAFAAALPAPAQAGPYVGQTVTLASSFCPVGWAPMNGQLMAIADNETLFNLIGTTYGGDGINTFALPTAPPILTGTGAALTQCISLFGVYPSQN